MFGGNIGKQKIKIAKNQSSSPLASTASALIITKLYDKQASTSSHIQPSVYIAQLVLNDTLGNH